MKRRHALNTLDRDSGQGQGPLLAHQGGRPGKHRRRVVALELEPEPPYYPSHRRDVDFETVLVGDFLALYVEAERAA